MAEVVITEGHNGGVVTARVGDSVLLKLGENPTTGFRWSLSAMDSHLLALTGDEFQPASAGIGGGGLRVFRFLTRSTGTAGIEVRLGRSWESGDPKDLFRMRITVA